MQIIKVRHRGVVMPVCPSFAEDLVSSRRTTMRSTCSLKLLILSLLLCFFGTTQLFAFDDGDDEGDQYDETSRVVRISLLSGDVNIQRHDETTWESAELNTAMVEGDLISTGPDSRVEIQFDARNFIRLNHDSVLRIVTLRDEGIALSISDGSATLRLAKFDREHEYFELDAPNTTIAAEKTGL